MANNAAFERMNETYVGNRLRFQETEGEARLSFYGLRPSFVSSVLWSAWKRGFLFAILASPTIFLGIGFVLVPLAFVLPFFFKDELYGGHWEYSVEDRADLAEPAFALTYQYLYAKQMPAKLAPRLVRSGGDAGARYYVTVQQGAFVSYVGVMAYGRDLYVSWTMWREFRPITIWWRFLVEVFYRLTGKGSNFHMIVRGDPARAMREAVHNSLRAGVDAAVAGAPATIAGTFRSGLAEESIAELDGTDAAPPAPVPQPVSQQPEQQIAAPQAHAASEQDHQASAEPAAEADEGSDQPTSRPPASPSPFDS